MCSVTFFGGPDRFRLQFPTVLRAQQDKWCTAADCSTKDGEALHHRGRRQTAGGMWQICVQEKQIHGRYVCKKSKYMADVCAR